MNEAINKLVHTFAALAELGEEIAENRDRAEMLRSALLMVTGALAIRRGALAEYDPVERTFNFIAMRGIAADALAPLTLDQEQSLHLVRAGLCSYFSSSKTADNERELPFDVADLNAHGIELIIPLVVQDETVGLLALGGKADGTHLDADDATVLCAMARHLAVGFRTHTLLNEVERRAAENQRLYDELKMLYKDTVRAFAAAMECKDKYTQGHSERVGKYSEIIARELGWDDDEVEGISIAGYLHDIGKLVVERDIINAPYKIDAAQNEELNKHPMAGYEILSPIRHPFVDIPLMARYHHERLDGRGYPDGLQGEEIPFGARIVTLADSFDAMTTDRPYKRRRALDEVVHDFRRNTGKQFDPQVVISFCRALLKEITGEYRERHFARILGKDYIERESVEPLLAGLIADLEAGNYGEPSITFRPQSGNA